MSTHRTIGQHLDNLAARYDWRLDPKLIMADPEWETPEQARLAVALWWKRRRWAAYRILDDHGFGALPEWQTGAFLDASERYDRAKDAWSATVASLWALRTLKRPTSPTETSLQHEAA